MLADGIMFVNGVPFLVSVARDLNLATAKFTPSRTAKQLAAGITQMMDLYTCRGLQVGTVLMDNEFKKLQNLVPILTNQHHGCKRIRTRGRMQDQVDQEAGKGHLKYPSIQENAKAHADRTDLSCGAVAECVPGKVRSV
jgi:hypothetical protein